MRTSLFLFLFFVAASATAQRPPVARKGFIFGASVGVSAVHLSSDLIGDTHQTGLSLPNFKFGWMLGPRTAAVLLLPGSIYQNRWEGRQRDRGFEGIVPSVQYWPGRRWWVLGGAGLGMDAPAFYDIQGETERNFHFGATGVVATGYELWHRGRFALDLQARAHVGFANTPNGRQTGQAFSVGLGLNWY